MTSRDELRLLTLFQRYICVVYLEEMPFYGNNVVSFNAVG